MDRIARQPDRTGEDGEQQFDQAGGSKTDRADGNRAVRLATLVSIVPAVRQRERRRWVP
jgi:hypothetical protein